MTLTSRLSYRLPARAWKRTAFGKFTHNIAKPVFLIAVQAGIKGRADGGIWV